MTWQPFLFGNRIRLRPLLERDFDDLFAAASDPLIWEQHPEPDRFTRPKFEIYFRSAMESRGALVAVDRQSGKLVGCSRFLGHDPRAAEVEVGYTFLTRACWGGEHNRELKLLMLNHAFDQVETVLFRVGFGNLRSQRALAKIGAERLQEHDGRVTFRIRKSEWFSRVNRMEPAFEQWGLETSRLLLEPISESHAQELCDLFADPELHHFVPFEPPTLEKQRERCIGWARRRSPDGKQLWLNWVARERASGQVIAHFQSGAQPDGVATVGYLVARPFQRQGFASEGLQAVFDHLHWSLGVREIKAYTDSRNTASHQLARKLGMRQVDFVKDADFFKGASSDELVFSGGFDL